MSYGLAFGFPRNTSLAAAASPFAQLGPTLDLVFTGVGSSGDPTANDSLDLNFVGDTYSVAAPYMVWGGTGMTAENFQDIVTFSRATGNATYYNSSGYLTTAGVWNYLTYSNQPENAAWTKSNSFIQTNLLLRSEQFDGGAWSKSSTVVTGNAVIAPNGTSTADKITVNNGIVLGIGTGAGIRQDIAKAAAPVTYTRSFYAKAGEFNSVVSFMSDVAATTSAYATFNLSNGTYTGPSVSGFSSASASITDVGNGWYRCVLTATSDSDTGMRNSMFPVDTSATTGNGTSGIYLWGAQTVQGSVPGDYQATVLTAQPVLYADYNGALRARKLCEDTANSTHQAYQNYSAPSAGVSYTFTVLAKTAERSVLTLLHGMGVSADFNLNTGVATGTGSAIIAAGNGWYRCSITAVVTDTVNRSYAVRLNNGSGVTYTGDGSSGIYIADAQLNDGSSALPYYDTTQYPYYAPRFDYDPVTLAAKGLLIEEQRTNLLYQSNDFQTSWAPTNITRTLNSILSPSGNVDGVKLAATTATTATLYQTATVAATSATGSVYVKQGTGATTANSFVLRNFTTSTNLIAGALNYSTGVWAYSIGSTGVVVTDIGNGWWRLQISATSGITSGDSMGLYVGFSGGVFAAGDFVYAYGAQLEAGAFATSYIPTTTSQLTRAADTASVNTLSPWFNQAAGTLFVQVLRAAVNPSAAPVAFEIGDGTNNNRYLIYNPSAGTTSEFFVSNGGVAQAQINVASAFQANVVGKVAGAYQANDFQQASNGTLGTADTSGTLPTVTTAYIGRTGAGTVFWGGWIQRISYYPRRLPNADLQTLTT